MWALEQPCPERPAPLLADTPATLLAALAGALAVTAALVAQGVLPRAALDVAGVAAGHGALLATALAWATGGRAWPGLVAVALLTLAAVAARGHPLGLVAYAAPPLWLARVAARGHLAALGFVGGVRARHVAAGAAFGALLGGHLLVSASRTLRVAIGGRPLAELLGALAYDAGANVIAAECFFRGALFGRAQRRWSFAAATAVSTAAYVLRYLADPLLPGSVAFVVGAVFYLALLGAVNCWLLRWSGSLVPGLTGALVFFAAWRLLDAR